MLRGARSILAIVAGVLLVTLASISLVGEQIRLHDDAVQATSELAAALPQQTTELVAWKPLRNQEAGFYPDRMWLYTGRETYLDTHPDMVGDLKSVLRFSHYQTDVMTFNSLGIAPLRAVCWDESAHVIVFPPFAEFPDIHAIAKTDLRSYVSTGNNLVFLGGFASVGLINEIFGFQLKAEVYQEGPFYRSERYAPGTVFETLPSRIGEVGDIYGVKISSLPPGARSYYDTLGDSVVWSVRYDFGMVTYVGNNMKEAYRMGAWQKILRAAVSI